MNHEITQTQIIPAPRVEGSSLSAPAPRVKTRRLPAMQTAWDSADSMYPEAVFSGADSSAQWELVECEAQEVLAALQAQVAQDCAAARAWDRDRSGVEEGVRANLAAEEREAKRAERERAWKRRARRKLALKLVAHFLVGASLGLNFVWALSNIL